MSSALPYIDINTLRRRVAETKSASTARYYIAMLNRLELYNQSSVLDLNLINPDYISRFGEHLVQEGMTLSTIKLFKMAFRAVMKDAYGSDFKTQFKNVFKDVGSKNDALTYCISFDDLQRIANISLKNMIVLERARLVFLYCVVSGGLSLQDLKEMVRGGVVDKRLPQQKMILCKFAKMYDKGFEKYILKLGNEQYSQALEAVGVSSGVKTSLKPQTAIDSWVAIARRANLTIKDMTTVLPTFFSELDVQTDRSGSINPDRLSILEAAANALVDMKPRWFAMKCYKVEPTNMDKEIEKVGILSEEDYFSSFIPPESFVPNGKSTKKSIMSDLYFFNCINSTAEAVRKAIRDLGWVYTLAGTSIPAQISDNEMKTFMLLCDVSEGSISFYFPDKCLENKDFTFGREALITNGKFCGQVGVIQKLSNNKYKVVMSFVTLSAKIIAEIPFDFLKLL